MRVFLLTWGVVVVFFFVVVLATATEHDHSTTDEQKRSHPSAIDRGTQSPFQSLKLFLVKKLAIYLFRKYLLIIFNQLAKCELQKTSRRPPIFLPIFRQLKTCLSNK